MEKIRVGFALCGSFCMLRKTLEQLPRLTGSGFDIIPIMSETAYNTDTRFGAAGEFRRILTETTGKEIIRTVAQAEPIGPKKLLDLLIIAPCTGNTLGKLAGGITDTAVTMAAKAHLRNKRPLLIAVSTNDALSASAKNIGVLLNTKNVFFVPMKQDDPENKETSLVADMSLLLPASLAALEGRQLQPVLQQ
ncbi:MAG: dipicolinate synthase subunit B [Clostridia bacterium]|nr:dipicolinate synthase subunit B [Clostridia bacterium]